MVADRGVCVCVCVCVCVWSFIAPESRFLFSSTLPVSTNALFLFWFFPFLSIFLFLSLSIHLFCFLSYVASSAQSHPCNVFLEIQIQRLENSGMSPRSQWVCMKLCRVVVESRLYCQHWDFGQVIASFWASVHHLQSEVNDSLFRDLWCELNERTQGNCTAYCLTCKMFKKCWVLTSWFFLHSKFWKIINIDFYLRARVDHGNHLV